MEKITGLLIQPPTEDFYDTDIRLQPIGLGYLKAISKKYHPECQIIIKDYHHGHGRSTIPLPKDLSYLKDYYAFKDLSAFSTFHHYFHFGAPFEAILADINKIKPNFIGISSLFSPYYREIKTLTKLIKEHFPHIKILLGGSHVSAVKERILEENENVDFIITGEGEKPFVSFLSFLKGEIEISHVPNLGFRKNGEIILNASIDNFPLDEIPFPDLTDISPDAYTLQKKRLTFLVTSRSCPHRCSFCSVHNTFGTNYRRRSIDNVMQEIKKRVEEGYEIIDFEDDNLTFYLKEMKDLCNRIINEIPPHIEFVAMNGISYLGLDDELLSLMKKANFTHLNLALVSSDKSVRESTKRPHTISKYIEITKKAFDLNFKITSYQILGLPSESLDSMMQTLIFNSQMPVLLGASIFYLTPYSPIARNFPKPTEKDIFLSRSTAIAIENYKGQRKDLYTLFIITRMINFLKGIALNVDTKFSEINSTDPFILTNLNIIQNLILKNELQMVNKKITKTNLNFNSDLFWKIWNELPFILTREGRKIIIKELDT